MTKYPSPDTEDNDQKDDILPYGGRETTMMNYLVGAVMIAAGLTILFSKKRKKGQSK